MFGGIAIERNLLCLTYSEARGKVFLFDLEDRRLVSFWEYGGLDGGYADAGGVAMAADCTIYVADTANDVVRCFTPFGKEAGRIGRGNPPPPGAARRDAIGLLDRPRAVAFFEPLLYVACGERKLVRGVQRFRRDGRAEKPLRAFGEDEGRFGAPRGLCVGAHGILVADTLHGVVQRFTLAGTYVGHFPTGRGPGEASRPCAVLALPDGDVLVADAGDECALKRFSAGGELRGVCGADARLHEPEDLAIDAQGRVHVLDRDGERVHRLTADLDYDCLVVDVAEILHGE
jgi:hypothetical protein